MIVQKIVKQGDRYIVEIPDDDVEREHLAEGQYVSLSVLPDEGRVATLHEVRAAFKRSWQRNEAVYRAIGPE